MTNISTFPAKDKTTEAASQKTNGIQNHKQAATHHEAAAKHLHEAVKHHEDGNSEKAFESTLKASGHQILAKESHREILKQLAK